jgi:glutaredoxin
MEAQGVEVIIYTAPWCAPCKVLAAKLEAEGVTFRKVDAGSAEAQGLTLRALPTVEIRVGGKPAWAGFAPSAKSVIEALEEWGAR